MVKKAKDCAVETSANSYRWIGTLLRDAFSVRKEAHGAAIGKIENRMRTVYDSYRMRMGIKKSSRGRMPKDPTAQTSYVCDTHGLSAKERVLRSSRQMATTRAATTVILTDIIVNAGLSDERFQALLSDAVDRVADCRGEGGVAACEEGSSSGEEDEEASATTEAPSLRHVDDGDIEI
jgi:hypothetical protein